METSAHPASILAHPLSLLQEAALFYAHGRAKGAAEVLERAIAPGGEHHQDLESWEMLFDLHRAEADWHAFEQLSARFQATFGVAAPAWLTDEETAHLPPEMQHGGSAYFDLIGVLDTESAALLDAMRKRASKHSALHLDLSKITEADAAGCLRLSQTLRSLCGNGNSVLVTGADRLVRLLHDAAQGNGTEQGYWLLLLDLCQLRGLQADFERTAVEYALATGEDPPSWQPSIRPVIAPPEVEEKRDEPRYQPGAEAIRLRGIMAGADDPQLEELTAFVDGRQYVNINLSRLARMDFACASGFTSLLNTLAAQGKTVRLIGWNALLGSLLSTFELAPSVSLVERRP